jgi:hypothetical protein
MCTVCFEQVHPLHCISTPSLSLPPFSNSVCEFHYAVFIGVHEACFDPLHTSVRIYSYHLSIFSFLDAWKDGCVCTDRMHGWCLWSSFPPVPLICQSSHEWLYRWRLSCFYLSLKSFKCIWYREHMISHLTIDISTQISLPEKGQWLFWL